MTMSMAMATAAAAAAAVAAVAVAVAVAAPNAATAALQSAAAAAAVSKTTERRPQARLWRQHNLGSFEAAVVVERRLILVVVSRNALVVGCLLCWLLSLSGHCGGQTNGRPKLGLSFECAAPTRHRCKH